MLPEKYHRGRLPLVRAFRVTGSWFGVRLGFELDPGADVHGERANVPPTFDTTRPDCNTMQIRGAAILLAPMAFAVGGVTAAPRRQCFDL